MLIDFTLCREVSVDCEYFVSIYPSQLFSLSLFIRPSGDMCSPVLITNPVTTDIDGYVLFGHEDLQQI